jgi:hypothetical protein
MTTPRTSTRTRAKAPIQATEDVAIEYADEDATQEEEVHYFTPKEALAYEGTLYVKNVSGTFVSFDDGEKNVLKLGRELAPDDPKLEHQTHSHIKVLPPAIAKNPGFQKFWRQGKVIVSDDYDMESELDNFASNAGEIERIQQMKINGYLVQPAVSNLGPRLTIPLPANAPDTYVPGKTS